VVSQVVGKVPYFTDSSLICSTVHDAIILYCRCIVLSIDYVHTGGLLYCLYWSTGGHRDVYIELYGDLVQKVGS
jgi:hypothetical protein